MAVYPLYVAPTPYNASELITLDYAQAFDTMYLTHELYAPGSLCVQIMPIGFIPAWRSVLLLTRLLAFRRLRRLRIRTRRTLAIAISRKIIIILWPR